MECVKYVVSRCNRVAPKCHCVKASYCASMGVLHTVPLLYTYCYKYQHNLGAILYILNIFLVHRRQYTGTLATIKWGNATAAFHNFFYLRGTLKINFGSQETPDKTNSVEVNVNNALELGNPRTQGVSVTLTAEAKLKKKNI